MKKKGFTLIEVIIGLSLLGLISVTTLPIISSSLINLRRHNIRMKMNYVGEMVIERIKAFDEENGLDLYIYNTKVIEIIDVFRSSDTAKFRLSLDNNGENLLIEIDKKQHSDRIWKVVVYVYHDKEGSNINHVEYKTYLPQR